jgi:hypothetical protein
MKKFATMRIQKDNVRIGPEVKSGFTLLGIRSSWHAKRVSLLKNNGDSSQLISSKPSPEGTDEMA